MDLIKQLSENSMKGRSPLADRMRPRQLSEFLGQEHIVGEGKMLRRAIETDTLGSCIFFGPPGTGKTTLAEIIANTSNAHFSKLNAVQAGVKDVRDVINAAENRIMSSGQKTFLLLDECHRWSKSQSDSILPAMEKGIITFIGSTTENPMISMTGAIVSRSRIFQFRPIESADIRIALERALIDVDRGLGKQNANVDDDALDFIARVANGDVRTALNAIELAVLSSELGDDGRVHVDIAAAQDSVQRKSINVDDESFYNMLSAFCKSLRGSAPDAALAWFARMIAAGVDPRVIVRRMIAHASEDVGLANPNAMVQAVTAGQALEMIGMPEAKLPIAQAIIYIANSPKSNAVCVAIDSAMEDVDTEGDIVPIHLRDTSYRGAKEYGNGVDYKYPHNYPDHFIEQEYMPIGSEGKKYYHPSDQGEERNSN